MEHKYIQAMEQFEVPEEFWEAARPMYHDYELELAVRMGKNPVWDKTLIRWLEESGNKEPERLIRESYCRCVLDKCQTEEGQGYCITDFYTRYPYFAQYQPEEYAGYPAELVEKLNAWELDIFLEANREDVMAIASGVDMPLKQTSYLNLEEAYEMAEELGEEVMVVPCNCKAMGHCTEFPVNVCINRLEKGPNTPYDRGLGEIMTKDEVKKWIHDINKKGLMQCREHGVMCNCDGIYCYPVKVAKILNTRKRYPISNYDVVWEEDKCIQCGKCVKICNFQAFYKDKDKKIVYDEKKCYGCTICASNCPKQAITLKKKETGNSAVK